MNDVTRILTAIEDGDSTAADALLPLVYQKLRKLAAAKLSKEKAGQTIQPTVLVHEAFLRLVGREEEHQWNNRGHFFAAAAEAMRRILVERARRKRSQKRASHFEDADIETIAEPVSIGDLDLVALDEALTRLEEKWPDRGRLVKLRYFAGLTIPEASEAMGISTATAERHWRFARAWLHSQLDGGECC